MQVLMQVELYQIFLKLGSILIKPYIIGFIFYIVYLFKLKFRISLIEIILTLTLIFQVGIIIELIFSKFFFTNYFSGDTYSDLIIYLGDNNTSGVTNTSCFAATNTSVNNDNIPRSRDNPDYPRLIRYITSNIAVAKQAARRPMSRAIGIDIANGGNLIADVISN